MTRRHATIAAALLAAERERAPVTSLAEQWPDADIRDAYAIQLLGVSARVEAGAAIVGHKLGLTSRAMQRRLGIDRPTHGHLLDTMLAAAEEPVPVEALRFPHVEAEVAFVLGSALRGPDVSPDDVLEATDHLLPALEVLDTRFAGWPTLIDSIADNGATARVILGSQRTKPADVELDRVLALMTLNGDVVEQASTETELEHPARAVAWLANTLGERGVSLEAGHIVLSGARSGAVRVEPGDGVGASLGNLGSVAVQLA